MTLLEHLPSHVKPGGQADESRSIIGVLFSPKRVTPRDLSQSCHFLKSCPLMSLLELLPVVSLLEPLPTRVTPRSLPGVFLSSSGEFHSPSRVTLETLAQSCHFLCSCPGMSLLELLPKKNIFFVAMRKKILSNNTYCTLLRM